MKADTSINRVDSTDDLRCEQGLLRANRLVESIKKRWRAGDPPNAANALTEHPELSRYRSVVLNLAYAEYRQRVDRGESINADTFAQQFPCLEKSLYLLIEVQGLLSLDPDLQRLEEAVTWPEAGESFLGFDLVAEIGRGTFGRVFVARQPALGDRQIVVKIAPRAGGEAEILGRLGHPNIVPVYSLEEDPTSGLAAFCMPDLGRATLCDVLDRAFAHNAASLRASVILEAITGANDDLDSQESAPPPAILRRGSYVDGVLHLAAQLAEALAHSHQRGIYHRDLKPSNVLIAPDGRPLLLDFNLSIDARLPAWKIGGTLPYMAPEELARIDGTSAETSNQYYDPRSDIFSLGVIVYQLLTGKLPFGAMPRECSLEETACRLRQHQTEGPPSIRQHNAQVDRRLSRLVESCLAFEPDRRPETAEQLATELRKELSAVRRGRRWIGNHPRSMLTAGGLLLTITAALAAFLVFRPPYDVRQLQSGVAHIERGEYAEAVDCLSDSLRANPESAEALFARGRAYHRLEDFRAAIQDYNLAYQMQANATVKSCEAYCLSRIKFHRDAIAANQLAMETGYESPALLCNNIGFSYLALRQLDDAEKSLRQAIQLDGNLQAAHYNLVMVALARAAQGRAVSATAISHAIEAIEIGPCTAELCRRVAALYSIAARDDASKLQPAIDYVRKAIELGVDPKAFLSDGVYSALHDKPSFLDALKATPSPGRSLQIPQVIDPIDRPFS